MSAAIDKKNQLEGFVFGRQQPSAPELEKVILGAILLDKDALGEVIEILKPDSFYLEAHQHIYTACLSLYNTSTAIDTMTLVHALISKGHLEKAGGAYEISMLTDRVASAANIVHHAEIVAKLARKRNLLEISSRTIDQAYREDQDGDILLDETEAAIFALRNTTKQHTEINASQAVLDTLAIIDENQRGNTGISTGVRALDKILGGWIKGKMIVIAGRPGMGKTAMAVHAFIQAAEAGHPVCYITLEMPASELTMRMLSAYSGVDSEAIHHGKLSQKQLADITTAADRIAQLPIHFIDAATLKPQELRARLRRMVQKHGIKLAILDYLQLMEGQSRRSGDNREQEVSEISRAVKATTKELNIPVLALSQLSRAVETRGGAKRPMLSDLRDSGSVEQDADIVAFLYRPEYYNILEDEKGQPTEGITEFIVAKKRYGQLGTVLMQFDKAHCRFTDAGAPIFPTEMPPQIEPSLPETFTRPTGDIPF